MKKRIVVCLISWILFLLASCEKQVEETEIVCNCACEGCVCDTCTQAKEEEPTGEKAFLPTKENVRFIGRAKKVEDTLWLTYSGTGMEFEFTGTYASVSVKADDAYSIQNNQARIAIYVNGERVVDDMVDQAEETYTVFESETSRNCIIKVLKLSEVRMSTVGISKISVVADDDTIKPTAESGRLIEFIGDSITCGYGIDDDDPTHSFSTATEDVTKAFAYKTAELLEADYSMVAISGFGVISGKSDDGSKQEMQSLPWYYDRMGATFSIYLDKYVAQNVLWDFEGREPDVIVINLGSNDNTYTLSDEEKNKEFALGYLSFLKQIRAKNPNATIICTLGMVAEDLFPCIEYAAWWYTMETGDTNIHTLRLDIQKEADGYAADWHPSEKTHDKAAEKLTAKIKEIMGW